MPGDRLTPSERVVGPLRFRIEQNMHGGEEVWVCLHIAPTIRDALRWLAARFAVRPDVISRHWFDGTDSEPPGIYRDDAGYLTDEPPTRRTP